MLPLFRAIWQGNRGFRSRRGTQKVLEICHSEQTIEGLTGLRMLRYAPSTAVRRGLRVCVVFVIQGGRRGACLQRAADPLTRVTHEVLHRGLVGPVHDGLDVERACESSEGINYRGSRL
jgi:hypothetical protein